MKASRNCLCHGTTPDTTQDSTKDSSKQNSKAELNDLDRQDQEAGDEKRRLISD